MMTEEPQLQSVTVEQMNIGSTQESYSLKLIGGSNNSQIFEVYSPDQSTGQLVSIQKVLKTVSHSTPNSNSKLKIHRKECQDLENEFNLMNSLNHPNILKVEQKQTYSQQCALLMEKADHDLYQMLKKLNMLPLDQIKNCFFQIANAMAFTHSKGIAHNDIKLANIFVISKQQKVVLADYGFARIQDQNMNLKDQKERWATRCMTQMAPELIMQKYGKYEKLVDERISDVFAFGISLFQTIFLRDPFDKEFAAPNDPLFQHLYKQEYLKFWTHESLFSRIKYFSKIQNFTYVMDLLQKCLTVNPAQRISPQDILKHDFFKQKY